MTSASSTIKHKTFTHPEPFQLGGGVTIDTATGQYDNGFLACARTGWSAQKSDSTFVQAATNLASYQLVLDETRVLRNATQPEILNTSMLVLVGHGNTGLISTGDGMIPRTEQGYISSSSYSAWQSFFANIRGHGKFLTLCGCDCGGGTAGAQFLFQLATLLNMPVQGRTGLVYLSCPGAIISYQNGSVWQVAQPGVMPTPINPPTGSVRSAPAEDFWLKDIGETAISAIESVTILTAAGRAVEVGHDRSISLLAMANLDEPLTAPGEPSAILTGTIIASVRKGRKKISKTLLVFNDRLLQHEDDRATFHLCSPGFSEDFRMMSAR